jgi:hypothetical protein
MTTARPLGRQLIPCRVRALTHTLHPCTSSISARTSRAPASSYRVMSCSILSFRLRAPPAPVVLTSTNRRPSPDLLLSYLMCDVSHDVRGLVLDTASRTSLFSREYSCVIRKAFTCRHIRFRSWCGTSCPSLTCALCLYFCLWRVYWARMLTSRKQHVQRLADGAAESGHETV